MADITITNITSEDVHLGDLYNTLRAGESWVLEERSPLELDGMKSVKDAVLANKISVSVAYSAADVAAGFTTPVQAVEAADVLAVAADGSVCPGLVIRKVLTAGGGGADDVTIFAAGSLPFKMRVVDVIGFVVTNAAGTWQVRDEAAGAGTLANTVDSTTAGRVPGDAPSNATVVLTPGASKGLFIRRSDNTTDGEVFIVLRPES